VHWKIQVAAIGAVALLIGCGGGGDKKQTPPESTGVLHSKIQGVTYRTATRSGKTDANGNFKYLPGESVTFSVGGIELGSATGAATISLFTLAGMTPPTSELGLRRDLNRMTYVATPLSNAANRALFLLALDGDGNPGNGIDVSSHEAALADAKLVFDVQHYEFAGKLSGLTPGLNNNIPMSFAIKWLYRSLGVKMAGNVPVGATTDEQNDGVIDSIGRNEVDAAGDITSTLIDEDADDQPDVTTTYERDSLGRITRQRTVRDLDLDRAPDSDHTVVTTYDAHGNVTRVVEQEDTDANGSIDSETVVLSTQDAYGRQLESRLSIDTDYDGDPDILEVDTYTRDARGNLLRALTEIDEQADGHVDTRYVSDYTWDASNRQLTSSYTRDLDGDGHIDNAWRSVATYAASGTRQTYGDDYDSNGDGVYEQKSLSRYGYDSAGNATSSITDYEDTWGAYQTSGQFSYDPDRRPLSGVYSFDDLVDGTVDSVIRQNYAYDANGFQLSWEYVSEVVSTGGLGSWVDSTSYTYSAAGAETSSMSGTDFDNDGDLELSRRTTIEYAPSNDALAQIADQYLPALGSGPGYVGANQLLSSNGARN
jgi:hypothetical protein